MRQRNKAKLAIAATVGLLLGGTAGAAAGDTVVLGSADGACWIYSSFDGGATWEMTYESDEHPLSSEDIQLTNDGTGTALCESHDMGASSLLRTTDGGQTWAPLRLDEE